MTLPAAPLTSDTYLFPDSSGAGLGTFQQSPTSNILFTFDYSGWLASGETLETVSYTALPDTSPNGLVVSAGTIISASGDANAGVSFLVGGGVLGTLYQLSVTAQTSASQTKVDTVNIQVTPQGNGVGTAIPVWPYGAGGLAGLWSSAVAPATTTNNVSVTVTDATSTNFAGGVVAVTLASAGPTPVATLVAAERDGRKAITLINTGGVDVYLNETAGALAPNGIPLQAGGAWSLNTSAAVYASTLALTGTAQVGYSETY